MEASELFGICRELAQEPPSAEATRQLHQVLVLTCAEGCRQQGGAFGNLFSQVDYLGKKLGLGTEQRISMQTARRHTNTGAPISSEDWPYDIMAVARLIAAVFKEDVPGSLLSLLPVDEHPRSKGLRINKEYVRCIVSQVEDQYIMADTEDGQIVIDYRNIDSGRDFGYLQKLLKPGMQLNLLDCSFPPLNPPEEEKINHPLSVGKVVPGIVVVEPDFLIDISSLAACFTNYGHHPLIYTLNRLKEKPNTQATLLGNFAGTALDDIINAGDEATTARSLQRSFREQALRFCACPDFDAKKFKQQAEEQMKNIREAVALLSPLTSHHSPLLEPSFICERLGLQGRVDLMTANMSLLVEQKSGRNYKIELQSHDAHGLQLESHYVQLLLYYGVLRYNFGKTDHQVDMRLLYSRYPAHHGLLTVNYYRTLLREAIRLRNQIVATELLIARDGFQRILPLLNADVIYKDVLRDEHFHRYILPEVETLNSQFSILNSTERAYYERMLTFVYREQVTQKLGSSETRLHHTAGCTADLWQMPLQEKIETGNIIMGDTSTAAPNFRPGDMIYLYTYKDEPDVRRNILFKGSLLSLSADKLTVMLNNNQHGPEEFHPGDGGHWAIEHGGSDVGTGSAVRSLHRFITSNPRSRALLLGQRAPEADTSLELSRSYHPDYDDVLLRVKQARDYFLLVGPPGTGKTSMALRFIVEEEVLTSHVLLTAYTNRAVDEICAMLCDTGLPFLRLGNAASCDEHYRPYLLDTALAETLKLDDARSLIDRTPIIVATTSMLQTQPWMLELKHFSLAIVDEASQILEPGIIGLLSSDAIDRFVLVGDHKQLPAVVQQSPEQSIVTEQCLRDIGLEDCRQSLFERLLRWEHRQGRTQFIGTLHSHGRMHPDVALFPLQHFYLREQLHAVPLPHQQEQSLGYDLPARDHLDELLKTKRMIFLVPSNLPKLGETISRKMLGVETAPMFSGKEASPSWGRLEGAEALLVADLLRRIYRFTSQHFDPAKTVGVIVPYRRQIALIRQALSHLSPLTSHLSDISIDTVERYQGSQRDIIIYSLGITRRYQLDFLTATTFTDDDGTIIDRKLNVALTRARRQMIIVGRPDLLSHVPLFRQLIQSLELR